MSVKCFGQLCSEPDSFGQFWTSKTCLNYKSNSLQLMILKNDSQKYVSKMFQTDMFSAGQFWTVMDSFGQFWTSKTRPKLSETGFFQVSSTRPSETGFGRPKVQPCIYSVLYRKLYNIYCFMYETL